MCAGGPPFIPSVIEDGQAGTVRILLHAEHLPDVLYMDGEPLHLVTPHYVRVAAGDTECDRIDVTPSAQRR